MEESKGKRLPRFGSLDELVEHFDTHDWGDYLEQMPEAKFEVDIGQVSTDLHNNHRQEGSD
jgi:hypothetical protein